MNNDTTTTLEPPPAPATAPAAPPTAPPTTPPATTTAPTVEDSLEKAAPNFFSRMANGTAETPPPRKKLTDPDQPAPVEDPAAKKPDPKKEDKPVEPVAAAAPDPEKKEPVKPARRVIKKAAGYEGAPTPTAQPIDAEAIAEAAARGATKALEARRTEAPAHGVEFTPDEQHEFQVLSELERINPEFQGIAKRAQDYIIALDKAKLEPDSDEAAKLKEKYRLDFSDRDFMRAEVSLENAPIRKELEELKTKVTKSAEESDAERIRPVANQHGAEAARELAAEFGDTFKTLFKDDGTFDKAKAEAYVEENPDIGPIQLGALTRSHRFAQSVVLAFNGQEDQGTKQVSDYCFALEGRIAKLPVADRINEQGQDFIPYDQFVKLPKAKRAAFYTLSPDLVIAQANEDIAEATRAQIEAENKRLEKIMTKRGVIKAPIKKDKEAAAAPPAASSKPASPAATDTPPAPSAAPALNGSSGFLSRLKAGVAAGPEFVIRR